jgi:hypothetical protein
MTRSSFFGAAAAAVTAFALVGCDNGRDAKSSAPAPSPEEQRNMAMKGAIKDKPGEETGVPTSLPASQPSETGVDDVLNAVKPDAAKGAPADSPDAAKDAPADSSDAGKDAGKDAGGDDEATNK